MSARMKWWHWVIASVAWVALSLGLLIGVIQPNIESHDLRVVVGLLGGLLFGWIGGQLLIIGWYSR